MYTEANYKYKEMTDKIKRMKYLFPYALLFCNILKFLKMLLFFQ